MSVKNTIDSLALQFASIANPNYPTSGGQLLMVKSRPTVNINAEDFPLMILTYDWQRDNEFELHQGGGGHHKYWLALYVFVGGKNTDLEELHARIEPWPVLLVPPVLNIIQSNSDNVSVEVGSTFLPYRIGYYPWGGVNDAFFGLKTDLYIIEELPF